MLRLNLTLLLAVMVSAFYLVHVQYQSRSLYIELGRATARAARLEAEQEQLVVQKRAEATPARVQRLATEKLRMRSANPAITEYVTEPAAAPATGGQP